ncbi:hypothetical protein VN24_18395 [Paenibacillus beijingensis]|uniref:Uncharacterized protein n=1 Tax=Paenibacillus beijingensis TaxID=1126833 RepID=A0A0D5NLH5_9BACL|nr:hypothetical protein VN24_18395 [Paenibacillus beijingensis]
MSNIPSRWLAVDVVTFSEILMRTDNDDDRGGPPVEKLLFEALFTLNRPHSERKRKEGMSERR